MRLLHLIEGSIGKPPKLFAIEYGGPDEKYVFITIENHITKNQKFVIAKVKALKYNGTPLKSSYGMLRFQISNGLGDRLIPDFSTAEFMDFRSGKTAAEGINKSYKSTYSAEDDYDFIGYPIIQIYSAEEDDYDFIE